jgi:hypothetical protein
MEQEMNFEPLGRLGAATAILFLIVASAGQARADCGPLPKVPWWGNSSHQGIVNYVERKHAGNWRPYNAKWKRQLDKLRDVHGRGKAILITSEQIKIKGEELAAYIEKVENRLAVTHCLARAEESRAKNDSAELANFVTTAGFALQSVDKTGGEHGGPADIPRSSRLSWRLLKLEIITHCDGGDAVFKVANLGDTWPALGTLSVYSLDGGSLISERRLKMKSGQHASFKFDGSGGSTEMLAMRVDPSWYPRDFQYDATVRCG